MTALGTRRQFVNELRRLERAIARAFLVDVRFVRRSVTLAAVQRALQRNNVGAINDLLLNRAAFSQVLEELRTALLAGANQVQKAVPQNARTPDGARIAFRFDVRDPVVEEFLAATAATLVNDVVQQQREAIQFYLQRGLRLGQNPRQTALDIVGRVNRVTGNRVGGIIGLNAQQARAVAALKEALADPDTATRYFRLQRRDRRFDSMVKRSRRLGRPLTASQIERITSRYSDRLLQLRGETIARTETLEAMSTGRHQAMEQVVQKGGIDPRFVTRTWETNMDGRERRQHALMNRTSVTGYNQPFYLPDNTRMKHPGDRSLGAGADQIINCRCYERVDIDFIAAEASRNV